MSHLTLNAKKITSWSQASQVTLKPIVALYKSTIKTMDQKPMSRHHCAILRILTFDNFIIYSNNRVVFKCLHNYLFPYPVPPSHQTAIRNQRWKCLQLRQWQEMERDSQVGYILQLEACKEGCLKWKLEHSWIIRAAKKSKLIHFLFWTDCIHGVEKWQRFGRTAFTQILILNLNLKYSLESLKPKKRLTWVYDSRSHGDGSAVEPLLKSILKNFYSW